MCGWVVDVYESIACFHPLCLCADTDGVKGPGHLVENNWNEYAAVWQNILTDKISKFLGTCFMESNGSLNIDHIFFCLAILPP